MRNYNGIYKFSPYFSQVVNTTRFDGFYRFIAVFLDLFLIVSIENGILLILTGSTVF